MKFKNILFDGSKWCFVLFLLLEVNVLPAQEVKSNINNFIFDCNNCNSAGPIMAVQTSPFSASSYFHDEGSTYSSDGFNTLPGTSVTLYLLGADADVNCISTNQVIAEGPYKMEFMIDGNATFDANGTNFLEVMPILEASGAFWISEQIDLTISPDWDGSLMTIQAKFIDNEIPVNCSNDCGNAKDEDRIHDWLVAQQFGPCPEELNFVSLLLPASFVVSNNNDPAFFTLGTGVAGTYINEEVINLIPNFIMDDIDMDWLAAHPAVMTPTDVINLVLPAGDFIGGGFTMEDNGNFIDSYFVSHTLIPFTQTALLYADKGFSMVHTYSCNNEVIHIHNSQFEFNIENVLAILTQ